jgi:lipid kinase, YegS/Rv2252/BmrU family
MHKKLLFVLNPRAGKGMMKSRLLPLVETFTAGGYDVTVRPTMQANETAEIVRDRAEEYDVIVCSGGDGTINETISGLMDCDKRPILGYLPSGTVNDFATSLRIPGNIGKAAKLVLSGNPITCDVGAFNERYFIYVAAFGAFTEVAYTTPQQNKNILGRVAYFFEGIGHLRRIKSYHLSVEYEGGKIEDEFIFGMVTNSVSVGGMNLIQQERIALNDGQFEVCLIKMPKNAIELQTIINSFLTGKSDPNFMYIFKASRLHIFCDINMPWTLDGEFGGDMKEILIDIKKDAIQIITDSKVPIMLDPSKKERRQVKSTEVIE